MSWCVSGRLGHEGCPHHTGKYNSGMARLLLVTMFLLPHSGAAAQLHAETSAAFSKYVDVAQKRMQSSLNPKSPFLWLDTLQPAEKEKVLQQLRSGVVVTDRLQETANGGQFDIPNGLVHHWIGTVFVP